MEHITLGDWILSVFLTVKAIYTYLKINTIEEILIWEFQVAKEKN